MSEAELNSAIKDILLRERFALLDLSTRNRLLNVPLRTKNVRTIEIVDEKSVEVCRLLMDGKAFSFLPGRSLTEAERAEMDKEDTETGGIPQPEDDEKIDERGIARRHSDLRLQTRLTSEGLQKRLLDVWYDAKTLEEEQGVNILYLAVGLLRWYEAENSDLVRHAPLILVPVELVRTSAAEKFKLKWRMEEPLPNLSLQAKMKSEFGLLIEDFDNEDEIDIAAYFEKVSTTVSGKARWDVLPDAMILGFFSFAKFLMYRDLDPENWPTECAIDRHSLIASLLRDGFPDSKPIVPNDTGKIDPAILPISQHHVVDADSSQTVAIEEASSGRTMVVKGPPGTGKSQTITNIVAGAAANGKKVLFVAEKMAALDVVHRRLKQAGLGALTLELHSNKANKRAVLAELKRTSELNVRSPKGDVTVIARLSEVRDYLNAHAERLHKPIAPCGFSPFQILGQLVRLRENGASAGYALESPETWTHVERKNRASLVSELAERVAPLGSLGEHPWRGVRCNPMDPSEMDDLVRRLENLQKRYAELIGACEVARRELGAPSAVVIADIAPSRQTLNAAYQLPKAADRQALGHPAWESNPGSLKRLVETGRRYVAAKAESDKSFVAAALMADVMPIRVAVATKGKRLFRFLDGQYRAQIALLKSYLKEKPPRDAAERLVLIDRLIATQTAKREFEEASVAAPAFGQRWMDQDTDWSVLDTIVNWRLTHNGLPPGTFARLAAAGDLAPIRSAAEALEQNALAFANELRALITTLDLDLRRAFSAMDIDTIPLDSLGSRFDVWIASRDKLSRWILFSAKGREATKAGLGHLVEAVMNDGLSKATLYPAFERAYFEALRGEVFRQWPELKAFDGEAHGRLVNEFRRLDLLRIDLAQEHIAHKHAEERPSGTALGSSPLGVLKGEIAKKSRHLPIRQLLEKAGPAVQQLKPVFMMSPLSVAQFLRPGALTFDVLVIDEASQIEPVDALGAVARVRQIVVVGDERQLPPTRFFAKLTSDTEDRDDDAPTFDARDAESILDLCLAKGVPHRMLNWHYRSKHQSLIAVSNREFYENRLFIVPSPYDATAGMGLKFHHLPDAIYERGESRTNPIEARTVAEAVIRHAVNNPDQSLGVVAFSVAQRAAIMKELELARRANPHVEGFINKEEFKGAREPFIVRNLENIQGDERDVIFISVGYGKSKDGYLAMNFGPLSGDGGERRLNVLISRAKLRCEVFSSVMGDDIDLDRARSRGVAALKMFLTFAQTGKFGLGEVSGNDHDSVFEEQVAERLRSLGYDVKKQIGAAGFSIDLAIGDSEKPGRFVLGIECDGAQYHSSRSARDRDRLRQQVLEAHGWVIHRIWSTDWYLRPEEELKKVETKIAEAKAIWRERDEKGMSVKAVPVSFEAETIDKDTDQITAIVETAVRSSPEAAPLYREASFPVNLKYEPHQVPLGEMAGYVQKIIDEEGPIHIDEIVARIRILWGVGRAGSRIRTAVIRAVETVAQSGVIRQGDFYSVSGLPVIIRDRSKVLSASLRKAENLPPPEIREAVIKIVNDNFGASRNELVTATARMFGYSSTSSQLAGIIENEINALIAEQVLTAKGELLVRAILAQ